MLSIPLNNVAIPFLSVDADGVIVLKSAVDLAHGRPLGEQLVNGEASFVSVKFDMGNGASFQLGSKGSAFFDADALAQLVLIAKGRLGKEKRILLDKYGLVAPGPGQVYLVFDASGSAKAGASGTFPVGSFEFGISAKAGGDAGYGHAQLFPAGMPAGEVFATFFRRTRLPYSVDAVSMIPDPGEVLALNYGGYLSLGVTASFGYSVSKYAEAGLGKLNLKSKVDISSSVKIEGGVKLAGDFNVQVRRGHAPSWARVTLRKVNERSFTFSGSATVGIKIKTSGLPKDADKFIEAVLDLRTPQVVADIRDLVKSGPDMLFARAKKEKDALIQKLLSDVSERFLNRAFTSRTAGPLFGHLREIIAIYDELGEKAVSLVESIVERRETMEESLDDIIDRVRTTLEPIARAAHLDDLKDAIGDPIILDVLKQFVGDKWVDFLTSDDVFDDVRKEIQSLLDGEWEKLAAFVNARFESLGVNNLLRDLEKQVDLLRTVDEPEKAVKRVEKHLLALAERMTDTALLKIKSRKSLRKSLEELQTVLVDIEDFKSDLYGKFQNALNASHRLSIATSFSRAKSNRALVDTEFDLSTQKGRSLMKKTLRGNLDNLFDAENLPVMKLHEGALTHRKTTDTSLRLELFGWTQSSFRTMVTQTAESIRQEGDGLLHVYAMSANEDVTRKGKGEEIKLNFVLGLLARGTQKDTIETVERMSAGYTIGVDDRETSEEELLRYLTLAGDLGLLPKPEPGTSRRDLPGALLDGFRKELGREKGVRKWGRVTLKYEVRYPSDAILGALMLPKATVRATVRDTLARVVGGSYLSFFQEGEESSFFGRGSMWHYRIGRLLLERPVRNSLRKKGNAFYSSNKSFCTQLEGEEICVGGSNDRISKLPLQTFFQAEKGFETALEQLHDEIKKGNPKVSDLEDDFAQLAEQRNRLASTIPREQRDRFSDPFFAILDQLIRILPSEEGKKSTLDLTIRVEKDGKNVTLTKIYAV